MTFHSSKLIKRILETRQAISGRGRATGKECICERQNAFSEDKEKSQGSWKWATYFTEDRGKLQIRESDRGSTTWTLNFETGNI